MKRATSRRGFLRTASAATGAIAVRTFGGAPQTQRKSPRPRDVTISSVAYTPIADYPIRGTRASHVTLSDTFWKPRVATNATVTIPLLVDRMIDRSRGVNGNVLEAAMLSLEAHPDPKLQAIVDARVAEWRQQTRRGNGGFEVAAAYYHATGKRDLLESALEAAEDLYTEFRTVNPPFSGGERDALSSVQLYRATREKKHLDLAKHYLDIRGLENSVNRSRHNQSFMPVLEQREAVGHAVNGVTLMVSLLDVGVLTGLTEYVDAAKQLWLDVVTSKMYVTGGVGSTGNEGFGTPYSLPTISAYAETCAVLMFATLNHKLFLATGDGKYIDVLERGIYNNALSGVALSGDRFFYVNRLASAGDGRDTRWERASLECCPPNLVRFLASMPGYIYAHDPRGAVYVNLYVSSEARFDIAGQEMRLAVESEMPWGGTSTLTVSAKQDIKAAIKLRVPGWAGNRPAPGGLYTYVDTSEGDTTVSINGSRVNRSPDANGYISLDRVWRHGDVIVVALPFGVRRVVADSRVKESRGRMAIERGPLVYCAEWPEADNRRVLDLVFDAATGMTPNRDDTLLGGVTVIRTAARRMSDPTAPLAQATLIPYPVWANRGAGEMTVWLSTKAYEVGDTGPAGGLIFYVNPNFAADGWRFLEAAPVDQSAGAPWGCFRTEIPGARGVVTGTGRQNTRDMLAACQDRGTAADLCATYVLNGVGGWFLPSRDELALMYRNLKALGSGDWQTEDMADNCEYWTSSQQTADMANHIDFADNGRLHYDDKDFPRRVRAARAF